MSDEALRSDSDMGRYAAQVLDNPAFQLAWQLMDSAIVTAWAGSAVHDTESQQLILQQKKLLDRMRATFTGLISKGQMADADLVTKADRGNAKDLSAMTPIERERSRVSRQRRA